MIQKQEVIDLAKARNIEPRMVEKDYVLGWVLAGINQNPLLMQKWIFKGGTALKKCYFDEYRFSEDLDFTVLDRSHINIDFLQNVFLEILNWVYEQSNIEFAFDRTKFDVHPDANKQYITGSIYYTGPLRQRGTLNKIILDILGNELLVLPSQKLTIYHPYSDKIENQFYSNCYCLEEIFAEKIRALSEHARPRDLYDVISLYQYKKHLINEEEFKITLYKKCAFKEVKIPTLKSIHEHSKFEELQKEWGSMLEHQVSELPKIDIFLKELTSFFEWLEK